MLFLWSANKYGKIWLDGEPLRLAVSSKLPEGCRCQEVSFLGEKSLLNIFVSGPEHLPAGQKKCADEDIGRIFAGSGIVPNVEWIHVAPEDEMHRTAIWRLPLFWAGIAAALTALVFMGLRGILWSLFAGVVGYGISWIAVTEDGRKQLAALIEQIRR